LWLTIHRGSKEIGGSCIELSTAATRLLLDFGLPLADRKGSPMKMNPKGRYSEEQLFALGLAPLIHDVFRDSKCPPQGLLLTHSHIDHYGLLPYLHESVPIFALKGTKKILEIAHLFRQTAFDPGRLLEVQPWAALRIQDFLITPYLVDHSAIDACGYLIEGEGKRIFYTGDFRSHGRKGVLFQRMLEEPPNDIDYLILEGTMLGRETERLNTEQDIEDNLVEHFQKDGLCVAAFSSQNIDRFVTFFKACRRTKRTLVVDPYTAHIMYSLKELSPNLPQYDWKDGFKVFFVPNTYTKRLADNKLLFRYRSSKITIGEIERDSSRLVLKDNARLRRVLERRNLLKDARLIYSMWEGYLDQDSFWESKSIPIIYEHCSGHAYEQDLVRLVEALKPRYVIPNHTFHPERFKTLFGDKALLLEDGQALDC
jgi:ribonuclease J